MIRFWLGKGVDGFRVDAVPHLFEVANLTDEPKSNNANASPDEYTYLDHPFTKDQPETYELVESWRETLDNWAREKGGDERVSIRIETIGVIELQKMCIADVFPR